MKLILALFFASTIHYSDKIEYRSSFGPTRPVCDHTPGWTAIRAKSKYVKRTDSTVTVQYPGTTVVYILARPKNQPAATDGIAVSVR